MANPYTTVSITGYNQNAPPDDSTRTAANLITWKNHKEKIGDPLKAAIESINTNTNSAFASIDTRVTSVEGTKTTVDNAATTHAYAFRSSSQSISSNTWTKVFFNSQGYDSGNNFSGGEYTVPQTGWYLIAAAILFNTNSAPQVAVRVGGSHRRHLHKGASNSNPVIGGSVVMNLSQGDKVQIYVRHQDGSSSDIGPGGGSTYMMVSRLI